MERIVKKIKINFFCKVSSNIEKGMKVRKQENLHQNSRISFIFELAHLREFCNYLEISTKSEEKDLIDI
ncbi:hypothetical protein BpHYR1_044578 [Brachionus plicatilis]|uniref:Uncharacterized protein n=1 Tax=Brachionus plicatilis TaxID=10195 RepID=A0A3M7PWC1_BRAPC|nr:hypothetical protein BpHYR1_044578 [Brachionus plicatilis]